ncbi:hypothetical protein HMPREF9134_00180 [Porphyromonas catoniae F0037]|uniref:Uncharacterized protein n=1 Tax=Porphyromonas catoniae F0037 TaxID=1127696 RepID=L1NHL0_9PORP|nr:hypothetical protein HMPREF9134_00180 [Porphyromonas catoniae F0037]
MHTLNWRNTTVTPSKLDHNTKRAKGILFITSRLFSTEQTTYPHMEIRQGIITAPLKQR